MDPPPGDGCGQMDLRMHWGSLSMAQAVAYLVPEVSDEALAARARGGARSAFATLVERHQDRVYRLALRIAHNPGDAEEIAQETFLLAYRGIGSFHGDARFSTWLYRIACNQALMRRRSARRHPVQSLEVSSQADERFLATVGGDIPEHADDLVDGKALAERVRSALSQLDEAHRSALVLRDLEGLPSEQAAEILGISADAVRQRAHRARLQLRELLGEFLSASPRTRACSWPR